MGDARAFLSRVKAAALERLASRPPLAGLGAPAFSMTFDDVPRSAALNGVPILLDHQADATFYVASGLRPQDGFLRPSDLGTLTTHGFDIACHTFSHYSLYRGTSEGLARDAALNRAAFQRELGLRRPRDLAYPFGEVTVSAKRRVGWQYATARSTYGGVNGPGADLLLLRANPLFSDSISWEAVEGLLAKTADRRGWVIFYTHGVDRNPGQRDCTPEDLDRLLRKCRRAGLVSRSVRSVSEELLPEWTHCPDEPAS